ncbi:hypothetical protein MJH12_04165, partial [bacterium]|nr:hypothetical protein [bacterium]
VSLMLTRTTGAKELSLSKDVYQDQFYVGSNLMYSHQREQGDGLTWQENNPSLIEYISQQKIFNLIYAFIIVGLLILGDFRYCNRKYEVKVLLLIFLTLFIVHLIMYLFFYQNIENLEHSLRAKFVQRHIKYLRKLESSFNDHLLKLEKDLSKDFLSNKPLSSKVYGDYIGALTMKSIRPKSTQKVRRGSVKMLNLRDFTIEADIIKSFVGTLVGLHKEFEDFYHVLPLVERISRIERKYDEIGKRKKSLMQYNPASLDRLLTKYQSLYSDSRAGKFSRLSIVKQGYFIVWNKKGSGKTFKFYCAALPGGRLFDRFLSKEFIMDANVEDELIYSQDHKGKKWGSKLITPTYYEPLMDSYQDRLGTSFNTVVDGVEYWGVFLSNVAFPQVKFLFLSKIDKETIALKEFKDSYIPANWTIFLVTIIL